MALLQRISLTTLLVICAVCRIHSQSEQPAPEIEVSTNYTSPPAITAHPIPSRGYDLLILDTQVSLKLTCDASGTPPPTFRWVKYDLMGENSVDIDENDPRVTLTGGNLEIASPKIPGVDSQNLLTESDEGKYQCIAENTFGSALSKKVEAKLAFIDVFPWVEPVTINAQIGEKVVLNCDPPEGVPETSRSIYWTMGDPGDAINNPVENNDRVLVDGDGNLVFANAQSVDDKNYLCNAPNTFIREVKTSPVISLIVNTNNPAGPRPPAWVYKPATSQEVLRTQKMKLKCVAEGYPTPEVTWSWEDKINPAGRIDKGPTGSELVIRDMTFDDAGEYTCEATNSAGGAIRSTTTITVRSAPYWDPSPPEDETIAPQDSVTISCQAGGSPAASISWLINGKPESAVEDNPRREVIPGQGSGQIIVTKAETSDSAVFQCVAKNKYGEEITSVFLNVLAIPAEIRVRPNAQYEIAEGGDVEMDCKPFGAPHPNVVWSFNGQEIRMEGGKYSIATGGSNEGMLTIAEVTMEDKGQYTCNVSNSFGVDVATPRVIVRMQTAITEGPGDQQVTEGDNAVLPCQIESDPELDLTVSWTMTDHEGTTERAIDPEVNSNRYRLGSDNSLTIIETVKMDGGIYTCKAITTFSEAQADGTVTILSAPDAPYNVEVNGRANELDVTVNWLAGNDGNSDITTYTIQAKTEYPDLGWEEKDTVSASSTSATISLKAYNTYNFRVTATNAVGTSQPSEMSDGHTTPERAPILNPSGVRGSGPEPGLMVVTWDKMHPSDYAGPDFKYIVRYKMKGSAEWKEKEVGPDREARVEIRDESENFQEYDVQVVSQNSVDRNQEDAETVPGMSGESEPTAAPGDVNVEGIDSSSVRVSWTDVPEGSINGLVLGYKVYTTITIAANSEEVRECNESPCVVDDLQAFSSYSLKVAVYNGAGEGPRSSAVTFDTPQGPPSIVLNLEARPSSDRILVTWDKPESHNGILSGYNLMHSMMLGNEVKQRKNKTISDPDQTRLILDELEPEQKYYITVAATTAGGDGPIQTVEKRTRPKGAPLAPKMNVDQVGPYSMNISYEPLNTGAAADYITVKYHKKGDDASDADIAGPIDLFEKEQLELKDLQPNTKYMLQLVAKNKHGETEGKWQEEKTTGAGAVAGGGFKVEGWFVALIVIIILLLVILLIICVLKSQKGGKYNVSDKEQALKGDIESAPLKDEGGFEEFQPGDGNMDEGAPLTSGSHPSLIESEAGSSETDSLKEYAEGDTGKFNEEGSFIGQYGDRKTRPPEGEGQDGAAYSTFV